MKFPETDPATYKAWMKAGMQDYLLKELEKLLLFVRRHPICGLEVGKIRVVCFTPFGGDMFNRKVWLYMNEIEAYNKGEVDEKALEEEWKLSGLVRPMTGKVVIVTVENTVGFEVGKKIMIGDEKLLIEKVIDCNRLEVSPLEWVLDESQQWRMVDSRGKYI